MSVIEFISQDLFIFVLSKYNFNSFITWKWPMKYKLVLFYRKGVFFNWAKSYS